MIFEKISYKAKNHLEISNIYIKVILKKLFRYNLKSREERPARYSGQLINKKVLECNDCNLCERVCPTNAISFYKNKEIVFNFSILSCTYCELCLDICPDNLLSFDKSLHGVNSFEEKFILGNKFLDLENEIHDEDAE